MQETERERERESNFRKILVHTKTVILSHGTFSRKYIAVYIRYNLYPKNVTPSSFSRIPKKKKKIYKISILHMLSYKHTSLVY